MSAESDRGLSLFMSGPDVKKTKKATGVKQIERSLATFQLGDSKKHLSVCFLN